MLGKLLKYEFKATGRKFLPIYGAIILISLLLNFGIRNPQFDIITVLAGFTLFGLVVALVVISLMTIIQRFKQNLLGDEGYLMFTLPVSTEKLILSKLITAAVWVIISFFVGMISGLVVAANEEFFHSLREAMDYLPWLWDNIRAEHITWLILGLICLLLQLCYFILLVYTSLSVSQMAVFNKHRGWISFISFIVLVTVVNIIVGYVFKAVFGTSEYFFLTNTTLVLRVAAITDGLLCAGMFAATDYLLKRHLNIE